jgi:DNA-directed RNA polymerase specialized sigma24 family protein
MAVLARSAQVEAAFSEYAASKSNTSAEVCLDIFRPWLKTLVAKHPLWVQDDLYQELTIVFFKHLPKVMEKYRDGKIRKLIPFVTGIMHHEAIDLVARMSRNYGKYLPIDDADLAYYTHPGKEQELKDLIAYVRKAIGEMISYRFVSRKEGIRASKWIQTLLKGYRPPMQSDCVARFNHSRYVNGKHMYSVVLHRLRELFLAGGHEVG